MLFLVIGLFSLIFHELGHVIAARLNRADEIRLTIGAGKEWIVFSIGRLEISLHRFFFVNFGTASNRDSTYNSKELMMISIMGPIFNVFLAIFFYVLFYSFFSMYVLYIGFLFNMWLGIVNLLPFRIGQKATDGYMIFKAWTDSR